MTGYGSDFERGVPLQAQVEEQMPLTTNNGTGARIETTKPYFGHRM